MQKFDLRRPLQRHRITVETDAINIPEGRFHGKNLQLKFLRTLPCGTGGEYTHFVFFQLQFIERMMTVTGGKFFLLAVLPIENEGTIFI